MPTRPATRKIVVEQGRTTGKPSRGGVRRQRAAPLIPSLVPPGARQPKGSIRVDAGAASSFRGRRRQPGAPTPGSPIVRAPTRIS